MREFYLTTALALALVAVSGPAFAALEGPVEIRDTASVPAVAGEYQLAKGGRGRRPRIPGGSGCDDPGDIAEHPECRPGAATGEAGFLFGKFIDRLLSGSNRQRPRIPGGSGCDDPGDILEHPECTP